MSALDKIEKLRIEHKEYLQGNPGYVAESIAFRAFLAEIKTIVAESRKVPKAKQRKRVPTISSRIPKG